jgi:hypothetical protein
MRMPGTANVPLGTPRRVGESSITTSALAPAFWARNAFSRKKHTPRLTSGTSPAANPEYSSASQPLLSRRSGPLVRPAPE